MVIIFLILMFREIQLKILIRMELGWNLMILELKISNQNNWKRSAMVAFLENRTMINFPGLKIEIIRKMPIF